MPDWVYISIIYIRCTVFFFSYQKPSWLTLSPSRLVCLWWCPWWRNVSPCASLDTWEGFVGSRRSSGPDVMCNPERLPHSHHPLLQDKNNKNKDQAISRYKRLTPRDPANLHVCLVIIRIYFIFCSENWQYL